MNNTHLFQPTPAPIILAMWQYLGRLTMPTLPTAGISWRDYIRIGGPATYIGRAGRRVVSGG